MPREATPLQVHVVLTPEQLALIFADMSEDEQALFFIAVGRLAAVWPAPGASMQWYLIGRRLREHAASTYAGRQVVVGIAEGLAE